MPSLNSINFHFEDNGNIITTYTWFDGIKTITGTEQEYYVYHLSDSYLRYIALLDLKKKHTVLNEVEFDKEKYDKIFNNGLKEIKHSLNDGNICKIYEAYNDKLQNFPIKIKAQIFYYFIKCIDINGKEYIDIDCSINPRYDPYEFLDNLYINRSKALNARYNETYKTNNFMTGFKTLKGKYIKRLLESVYMGIYKEELNILPLIHYCHSKKDDLYYIAKKELNDKILQRYNNIINFIKWEKYLDKETRRQNKLAKDGKWVNETLMFNFIKELYPDAQRQWRPAWLVSEKGGQLSCDVYIPSINTVFEYQGKQHFEFVPFFDKDKKSFERRQYLDKLKYTLLNNHNVKIKYVNYNETLTLTLIKEKLAKCA